MKRLIFSLALFFAPLTTFGQAVDLNVTPQNPSPGEKVFVNLSGYGTELSTASISWKLNDKIISEGIGMSSVDFVMADAEETVSATVTPLGGSSFTRSRTIRGASVTMLYEVLDGYAPPLYKGKVMPVFESRLRAVVIPDTNFSDINYSWEKEYISQPGSSGQGRSHFDFANSVLETSNNIGVNVTSSSRGLNAREVLTVTPGAPQVLFYEEVGGLGTNFAKAIKSGAEVRSPFTVSFEPYFMSVPTVSEELIELNWLVDGQTIPSGRDFNTLKIERSGTGKSSIGVDIERKNRYFQDGEVKVDVEFIR